MIFFLSYFLMLSQDMLQSRPIRSRWLIFCYIRRSGGRVGIRLGGQAGIWQRPRALCVRSSRAPSPWACTRSDAERCAIYPRQWENGRDTAHRNLSWWRNSPVQVNRVSGVYRKWHISNQLKVSAIRQYNQTFLLSPKSFINFLIFDWKDCLKIRII